MRIPLLLGAFLAVAVACAANPSTPPAEFRLVSPTTVADENGCALFFREDEIVHLWLFPRADLAGAARVELSLHVGNARNASVPLWRQALLSRDESNWHSSGAGIGLAFLPPDSMFMLEGGNVELRNRDSELVGAFEVAAVMRRAGATVRRIQFEGEFVAPRDTLFERSLFDPASGAAPHRCES